MRLQDWLDDAAGSSPEPDPGELAEARAVLEAAAGDVHDVLADPRVHGELPLSAVLPMRLSNSLVGDLLACEGFAVARAGGGGGPVDWAGLAGRALDAYVAHVNLAGPVADPVADLESIWRAQGRHEEADALAAEASGPDRVGILARLAAAAAGARVDPAWVPRVEMGVGAVVGGSLDLRGRVDLFLGGPGTDRPGVVVEVKSSGPRPEHVAQLRHYVLLAALRHGRMPAAAAVWYTDRISPLHLAGSALSAARRVAAATARLLELWSGRLPELSPGAQCAWCPVAGTCPAGGAPARDGEGSP